MGQERGLLIKPLKTLVGWRLDSSLLLFIAALGAVVIANTSLSHIYFDIINTPVFLKIGGYEIFSHHGETMSLLTFVNDVLMVIFFLQVGLEIKQEGLVGELSSLRKATLPVIAAIGGMVMPVLIFFMFCPEAPESKGLAIPMATDIAFALAVLSTLGKRVPPALKTFLASLAVADDIGGIVTIAIFYSSHIDFLMLLAGFAVLIFVYVLGRLGIRRLYLYYFTAFIVWYFFLKSGVHTTISGVLVAFIVSGKPNIETRKMLPALDSLLHLFPEDKQRISKTAILLPHEQVAVLNSMNDLVRGAVSPIQRMETQLGPLVNYIILPLFAFVNAGVVFGEINIENLADIPLAISAGLLIGKPMGIFFFSYIFIIATKTSLPQGMNLKNMFAVSCLGGIGFTVSLFVASLAFESEELALFLTEAKIGIFVGSILSGLLGYFLLKKVLPKPSKML